MYKIMQIQVKELHLQFSLHQTQEWVETVISATVIMVWLLVPDRLPTVNLTTVGNFLSLGILSLQRRIQNNKHSILWVDTYESPERPGI